MRFLASIKIGVLKFVLIVENIKDLSIGRKNIHFKILKTGVLFLVFVLLSCEIDDISEEDYFTYKLNPIQHVNLPRSAQKDEVLKIDLEFENLGDCYDFIGFDMKIGENENERIISAVSTLSQRYESECILKEKPVFENGTIEFSVIRNDYYILKFFQGRDSLDQPIYLEKEISITE